MRDARRESSEPDDEGRQAAELEGSASPEGSGSSGERQDRVSGIPDPIVIGQYEVHELLGSGGMATVHLGRKRGPAGFTKIVAIKRLHPHLARDEEFVTMFLDEARLAARINHPNVVETLDVQVEGGEFLLALEYVHGE